eukprot:TRINITY_DN63_c0_g1_i1.p1 TRINITY_DN63_c0_g1~~TRINITY_DN63_c0_g1_i1.p1  ORF type:complete len:528 (-),score=78.89 TRINITY_DN63_c0_g1_i1:119-1702(-)
MASLLCHHASPVILSVFIFMLVMMAVGSKVGSEEWELERATQTEAAYAKCTAVHPLAALVTNPPFCAGGTTTLSHQRTPRIAFDSNNQNLYYGFVGGYEIYDTNTWKQTDRRQFSESARFQTIDFNRNFVWLATQSGVASIDLEKRNSSLVYSDLNVGGTYCAGNIDQVDEIGGFGYSTCVVGGASATLVKTDLGDANATIVKSLEVFRLGIDESIAIVGLSPDRRRSLLYAVRKDYLGIPRTLYQVSTRDMKVALQLPLNSVDGRYNITTVLGADLDYVYLAAALANKADSKGIVVKLGTSDLSFVKAEQQLQSSRYVNSFLDSSNSELVMLSHNFDSNTDFWITIEGSSLKEQHTCQREPRYEDCVQPVIESNVIVQNGMMMSVITCPADSRRLPYLSAVAIQKSTALSCSSGCENSAHGQCINQSCRCFDGWTGDDCGLSHNGGCHTRCESDDDCRDFNPPFNNCPHCYSKNRNTPKTCQPVCTAPCESTSDCERWAHGSVLNQQCQTCNSVYKYCGVRSVLDE